MPTSHHDDDTTDIAPDIAARLETRVANGEAKNAIGGTSMALAALDEQDKRELEGIRAKVARVTGRSGCVDPGNRAL